MNKSLCTRSLNKSTNSTVCTGTAYTWFWFIGLFNDTLLTAYVAFNDKIIVNDVFDRA
jgi:hypothetical protein